jgi:hypothetical protein
MQYWLNELTETSIDRGRLAAARGLFRIELRVALALLGASIVVTGGVMVMQGMAGFLGELLDHRSAGRILAAVIAVAAVLLAIVVSHRRARSRIDGKWRNRRGTTGR